MERAPASQFPWSIAVDDLTSQWKTSPEKGLDEKEVRDSLRRYGPNKIEEFRAKSAWRILYEQFNSIIVLCLAIAAGVAFAFGDWKEAIAIVLVILLNGAIGFLTEWRAVRSMEALRKLSQIKVKVLRGGKVSQIGADDLVPGDLVLVEGGDIVGADIRLTKVSNLQVDESLLTGESAPVAKTTDPVSRDTNLAERTDMLFRGTSVTRGSGEGIVVETGMRTEFGKIAGEVQQAEQEITPLEKRLAHLGRRLVWLMLGIMVLVAISGILAGRDIVLMIKTAIALAVAGIPEGLPIVATVALAKGMWRMARRNALINRLSSVETLGATNVIFIDKTGTLTENRMTVTRLALESGEIEVSSDSSTGKNSFQKDGKPMEPKEVPGLTNAIAVSVLCNTATLKGEPEAKGDAHIGDPMEIAFLVMAAKAGFKRDALLQETPEVRQESFDPKLKMMATIHRKDGEFLVAVKGASESVISRCSRRLMVSGTQAMEDRHRGDWLKRSDEMASEGLRILALAEKRGTNPEMDPYEGLTFIGLIGLLDPPRKDVRAAIRLCHKAGIRVIMVTGDQAPTAKAIGEAVGISSNGDDLVTEGKELRSLDKLSPEAVERLKKTTIFARVEPKQKLDLISLYQKQKQVVAMTGDGVNDAPALKKADIGIAMGQRGTEVAREASDMILKDDAFTSIVAAVEEGRIIFGNIRKFVVYLLSCNISEILVVGLASMVNAPLPLLPLQILYLNLVTDVFPALALGVGGSAVGVMDRPPRDPREPLLARQHWVNIGGFGALLTVSVLVGFTAALVWLDLEEAQVVTVSFLSLGFAQLWHIFNMRESGSSFLRNEVTQNPFAWGAIVLCSGLLLIAVFIPGLNSVLRLVPPSSTGWLVILTASFVPFVVGQLVRSLYVAAPKDKAGAEAG